MYWLIKQRQQESALTFLPAPPPSTFHIYKILCPHRGGRLIALQNNWGEELKVVEQWCNEPLYGCVIPLVTGTAGEQHAE